MIGAGRRADGRPSRAEVLREIRALREAADKVSYTESRGLFRDGDVLLFRGRGPMSMAIRALTASPYSHVGLVYLFAGRVYSLEAVGAGVRLILMSEVLRRYHGGVDYYEVPRATTEQRAGAVAFCFQQLGRLYDRPGLLRFGAALVLGRKLATREDQSWFCSELVAAAYRKQGLSLAAERPTYTSPADLAVSPELKLKLVLKRET